MPANAPPRAPGELAEIEHGNRIHQAVCDWIREDAPLMVKLSVMPEDVAALVKRLASLRSATGDGGEAKERFDRLLIAFHDAIRRPLGVTPGSGAEFYDQRMAYEAEARRASNLAGSI